MRVDLHVNGASVSAEVHPLDSLLDLVRSLGLTGAKEGCGVGVCGLCSVLVDDLPVSSCLVLAAAAQGTQVETVEGLAAQEPDLAAEFVRAEAMQCGICTPGQVVMAAAARRRRRSGRHDDLSEEVSLREFMAGNLCRCSGYSTILEALRSALDC